MHSEVQIPVFCFAPPLVPRHWLWRSCVAPKPDVSLARLACLTGVWQSPGMHRTRKTMRFIKYATQHKCEAEKKKAKKKRERLDLIRNQKCTDAQEQGANEGWTHLWSETFYFLSLRIYRNRPLLWQRDDRVSIAIRSTVGKTRPRNR